MPGSEPNPAAFVADFTLAYTYKRSTGPVLGRFLGALGDGVILGARAPSGEVIVPASEYDPRNGAATGELVPVGPEGTLVSWTVEAGEPARGWALVLLDGAATAMLHRLHPPTDATRLRAGARVRARFTETPTGSIEDLGGFEVIA